MKILEVIFNFYSSGNVHFTVDLCNQLVADGHDVTLLSIAKPTENNCYYLDELNPSCKLVTLNTRKTNAKTLYATYKMIKKIQADIVHINSIPSTSMSTMAMLLYKKSKYVVTSHNQCQAEDMIKYKHHLRLIKTFFRKGLFDFVAISHENEESIYDVYGKHAAKIIYNGRQFMPTTTELESVRKKIDRLKNDDNTQVFTILARCDKQKNIPRLIRCFNEAKKRGANIILLIIGSGYDNKIGIAAKAEAGQHIHFIDYCKNVADYLAVSDFFTLSSDFEGMPLSLIEALSYECIPVSTPVSGVINIIKDGTTGFLAKDFTDEAYTDAIMRAVANKDNINKYELKQLYENNFTMEICAKKYEEFFKSLQT